jgi:uncharacterized protein (DUF302 family)
MLTGCSTRQTAGRDFYQAETTTKSYADVLAELELAITDRNFRITGHNKIGSVIRERENIAFPDFDTIQFCNLTLAREMLELAPDYVSYMPCNVAVRQAAGRVIVTTHLLPENAEEERLHRFIKDMNGQLRDIVEFAVAE